MTSHRPPGTPGVAPQNVADRLWSRVDVRGRYECWLWTGATGRGYGRLTVGSRLDGTRRTVTAHRLALHLSLGTPFRNDELACHRCDQRLCCNPRHLYVGSRADNARDWTDRGKENRGQANPMAKLDRRRVEEIRNRYRRGKESQRALAAEYGITQSAVWSIVNQRTWRDRNNGFA